MAYHKKFEEWGKEKKELHHAEIPVDENGEKFSPRMREIIYAKLGVNIGFESDGKKGFTRPVLILAKIGSLYWVAPLTSKLKENFFHHTLTSVNFKNIENSVVMLSQARVIDGKRFKESIGKISRGEFFEIQKKMKNIYFPSF